MSENNKQDHSPEGRLSAFKPSVENDIPHHVVERAVNRGPNLRARFRLSRGRWGTLAGTAAVAIAATAVALPNLTGVAGNSGYLFATGGSGSRGSAASSELGSDSKMGLAMPAFQRNYIAGKGLSSEAGSGHVFQLQPLGNGRKIAEELAQHFGISGEVREIQHQGEDTGATYTVGSDNVDPYSADIGTAPQRPSVTVDDSASANWISYGSPEAYLWANCHMGMTPAPEGCDSAPTGSKLPTPYEALKTASSILGSLGLKAAPSIEGLSDGNYLLSYTRPQSSAVISVDAGTGSTTSAEPTQQSDLWVEAALIVDGKPTAVTVEFNWVYGSGLLANMYGSLSNPVDRGSFDTLSPVDTLKRLTASYGTNQSYSGAAYTAYGNIQWSKYSYPGMTSGTAKDFYRDMSTCANTDTVSDCPFPVEGNIPVVYIKVQGARAAQLLLYANDGTQWLVPGFDFFDEDGGYLESAFNVVDGVIDVSQPAIEPMTR